MKVLRWLWSFPWSWIISLGSLVGAFLIWRSKKNAIATFEEAKDVQRLREKARADRLEADKLLQDADANQEAISALKRDIRIREETIVALASDKPLNHITKMTDDEVSAALTELGF